MATLRKEWSLHTAAGSVAILPGSTWGFDRSWAPQGAGTLVLPMGDPVVDAIVERDRQPLRLVCDLWHTLPGGTLGSGALAGTRLGDAAWPLEPLVKYRDEYSDPLPHVRRAWQVWPGRIRRDHLERTVTIEISTVELLLVEMRNGSDPWEPGPTGTNRGYILQDVLAHLLAYIDVPLAIDHAGRTPLPAAEMRPWATGESAWEWFDRLRVAADVSYRLDPTANIITFLPRTAPATGVLPAEVLERADALGGAGEQDFDQYADAILVRWRWEAAGVQREEVELALGPDTPSWQAARRTRTIDRAGPPVPGFAPFLVAELSRWRTVSIVRCPLEPTTLVDLITGAGQYARSIAYAIDEEPSVTFTIITEE